MLVPPIAASQAGAFTRSQAVAAGLGRDAVRRRMTSGRWPVLVADVLVERGAPVTVATRAWAAHLATSGVVSHRTAGAMYGLIDDDESMHVSSRTELHVRVPGIVEHRVRLAAGDTQRREGLPITTRIRTLADLLGGLQVGDARRLLFRAVQQNWIDEDRLRHEIAGRRGMTGNTQLRELARLLGTGAHSVAERQLHRILATVPGLDWRPNVALRIGGQRVVVDVLLRSDGIVIEVDGRRFHSDSVRFAADRRRQNALIGAGYLILRFTWLDLVERPERVREDVLAAISVSSAAKTARTGP